MRSDSRKPPQLNADDRKAIVELARLALARFHRSIDSEASPREKPSPPRRKPVGPKPEAPSDAKT